VAFVVVIREGITRIFAESGAVKQVGKRALMAIGYEG
jgi:hypothetical protein